jgi:hypothetical protein
MPGATPEFADVYGFDPTILLGGDPHNAPRRHAIVAVGTEYVRGLGRSSTHRPSNHLESPVDRSCRLDKPGVYSDRWLHSVEAANFANPRLCEYYGTLQQDAADALRAYWDAL